MSDFKLLIQLRDSLKEPRALTLNQLKTKTKEFRRLHNTVVESIWALGINITKATGEVQAQLTKERRDLVELLKECNSRETIFDLIKEIKEKEKSECGHTIIDTGSPYAL